MRKLYLIAALLLSSAAAFAQDEPQMPEKPEMPEQVSTAELGIVPRVETSWSNACFYTRFEGSASEHFSWTVVNHWYPFPDNRRSWNEYINLLRADLSFGSWTFSLGKDCITAGGHEYDDWDWEVYTPLASALWNGLACYQWGGKVAWTTPSEMSSFSLQMLSSPFGEPFRSGLWVYSAAWSGEYGCYSPLWSVSLFETPAPAYASHPKNYQCLVTLGNQLHLGNWMLSLDWSNTAGFAETEDALLGGSLFHGRVDYAPIQYLNLSVRGNYMRMPRDFSASHAWTLGGALECFPLRTSKDLRLHLFGGYDSLSGRGFFSAGVLYHLKIKLW